jgi:hypothetical protein
MSLANLNKEVLRFTLKFKQEVLNDVLNNVTDDTKSAYYTYINEQLATVSDEIQNFEKRYKASLSKKSVSAKDKKPAVPRPMSAYNKFIKVTLPKIREDFKDLDNKSRMKKASELWGKLSDAQKDEYKNMDV